MKCFYHTDRDAVAQCTVCGKALCAECAHTWDRPVCHQCAMEEIDREERSCRSMLIACAIGALLGLTMTVELSTGYPQMSMLFLMAPLYAWVFAGVPAGWSFLSRFQPLKNWLVTIHLWLFLNFAKFVIALFIGMFLLPFEVRRCLRRIRQLKQLRAQEQQREHV